MIWNFPLVLQRPVKPSILLIDYWHFYYFSINLLKRLLKMAQGSVLRIWGGLSLLQYYMGGKGRGELLKTLIWSIQFEHDDDDDQYWVNIKVWEAVQISGISRTESEKHEKLAVGSTCRCSSMLWSTFWSELYQKDFFIITYGGNLSPDRFPPLSSRTKTHQGGNLSWWEYAG